MLKIYDIGLIWKTPWFDRLYIKSAKNQFSTNSRTLKVFLLLLNSPVSTKQYITCILKYTSNLKKKEVAFYVLFTLSNVNQLIATWVVQVLKALFYEPIDEWKSWFLSNKKMNKTLLYKAEQKPLWILCLINFINKKMEHWSFRNGFKSLIEEFYFFYSIQVAPSSTGRRQVDKLQTILKMPSVLVQNTNIKLCFLNGTPYICCKV